MDGYFVAVAVIDNALWESFSVSSRGPRTTALRWICEHHDCDHEFSVFGAHCPQCESPTCPECGRFGCAPRVTERLCTGCFLKLPLKMFIGDADRCTECT